MAIQLYQGSPCGLKKNTGQIVTLFALSNLWMARHRLMFSTAEVQL